MKLEQQVCSLELSKRLKELGFEQESLFYWYGARKFNLIMNSEIRDILWDERCFENLTETAELKERFSAYTVAELGEMLPETIDQNDDDSPYFLNIHKEKDNDLWQIRYGNSEDEHCIYILEKTEADARAKMLIYLKENNLL